MGVTRRQVCRIIHIAVLRAIYPGKQLSKPSKGFKKYTYLLRDKTIWLPNQVWASDIMYLRLSGGDVYLLKIIDLYPRKILSWSISNTTDSQFCVAALEEAIARYGVTGIFNTDQGSQFTSDAFLAILQAHGIQISMDSVNRAHDTIIVERFWRSFKYEEISTKDYHTLAEMKLGVSRYSMFYNSPVRELEIAS